MVSRHPITKIKHKLISHQSIAPELSAVITASGTLDEGGHYSLTCAVSGDESLAVSGRRFQWDRVGGSMSISPDPTLTFNPLLYADEGEHRCTVNITSPYLIGTRSVTDAVNITVNRKLFIHC